VRGVWSSILYSIALATTRFIKGVAVANRALGSFHIFCLVSTVHDVVELSFFYELSSCVLRDLLLKGNLAGLQIVALAFRFRG